MVKVDQGVQLEEVEGPEELEVQEIMKGHHLNMQPVEDEYDGDRVYVICIYLIGMGKFGKL
jgi:hypothetical protein